MLAPIETRAIHGETKAFADRLVELIDHRTWLFESSILPLIPGLLDRMRLGLEVLELDCGDAQLLLQLAARFPRSRFHGLERSAEAITRAQMQARERGLHNVTFEQHDAAELGLEHYGRYDLIARFDTSQAQRDMLTTIAESLAPGGVYLMYTIASMRSPNVAWGREQTGAMLAAAGFASVEVHQLEHDLQNDLYVCRRGADELW